MRQDPLGAALAGYPANPDQGLNDQAVSRFEEVAQADRWPWTRSRGSASCACGKGSSPDAPRPARQGHQDGPEPERPELRGHRRSGRQTSCTTEEAVALRDRGDLAQAEKIVRPLPAGTSTPPERGTAQALMGDLLRRQGKQREAEDTTATLNAIRPARHRRPLPGADRPGRDTRNGRACSMLIRR